MQAFGLNQISVSRFRFASGGIFDRFQVSGFRFWILLTPET